MQVAKQPNSIRKPLSAQYEGRLIGLDVEAQVARMTPRRDVSAMSCQPRARSRASLAKTDTGIGYFCASRSACKLSTRAARQKGVDA